MHRLFRSKNHPQPRRGPTRWTVWEIGLIGISLLLIAFPLYAELYSWINPPSVPAASILLRATFTPIPSSSASVTPFIPTDTPTGGPSLTPTTVPPTPTSTPITPTPTTDPSTSTPTTTPGGSTSTPTPTTNPSTPTPTMTPGGSTSTPTPTPTPGTPTPTPTPGEPPLAVVKVASAASAGIGQQYSYSLAIYSSSLTNRSVTVQDNISSDLDVIGTPTASNGSCNVAGNTVNCSITVRKDAPVTIIITVRVRPSATPGSTIVNFALANDSGTTAQSDDVYVEVVNVQPSSTPPSVTTAPTFTPTSTPTITPGGPTLTPTATTGGPTNTPRPGATNTPRPGVTNTPRPGVTNTPRPGVTNTPGTGNGTPPSGTNVPTPRGAQTSQPRPPSSSTPAPGSRPSPTLRPGQTALSTPIAGATAVSSTTAVPGIPASTEAPTLVPLSPDLFFRMASDWGSAFPEQQVNYVVVINNTSSNNAMHDLIINVPMPSNLDILGAKVDRGSDPTVNGNTIVLKLGELKPGEGIEIAIETKIKASTAIGSQLVSQAQMAFNNLSLPAYSNIVSVLIVGSPAVLSVSTPEMTTTKIIEATTTTSDTAPEVSPTGTTATPLASTTPSPVVTSAPTIESNPSAPTLPNTSSGMPIAGFTLLGMTLMLRTVRIHRDQSRI